MGDLKESLLSSTLEQLAAESSFVLNSQPMHNEENQTSIWKDLPLEIFFIVLSKLSLRQVIRIRTVCKKWNSAIMDAKLPAFGPWCVLIGERDASFRSKELEGRIRYQKIKAYDTTEQEWIDWDSFCSIPSSISDSQAFILSSGAGSLLLFKPLMVFNPVNRSFKRIPFPAHRKRLLGPHKFLGFDWGTVSSLVDDDSSGVWMIIDQDLVTVRDGSWLRPNEGGTFSLYNSRADFWDCEHEFNPVPLSWNSTKPVQVKEGFLHYLAKDEQFEFTYTRYDPNFQSYRLAVYNLETREGQVLLQSQIPNPLRFAFLFGNRGQIMLLGGKLRDPSKIEGPRDVFIWQMEDVRMNWVEVGRMPEELRGKFCFEEFQYRNISCVFGGDYVGIQDCESNLFLFNFVTNTWSHIPWKFDFIPSEMVMFQPKMDLFL